jgi:hypothetical protein
MDKLLRRMAQPQQLLPRQYPTDVEPGLSKSSCMTFVTFTPPMLEHTGSTHPLRPTFIASKTRATYRHEARILDPG